MRLFVCRYCSSNVTAYLASPLLQNYGPNLTLIFIPGTLNCSNTSRQATAPTFRYLYSSYHPVVSSLKGTVARDGYLTISLHPRYRIRILHFFYFCRTLASYSVFGECAKISQLLMRTKQGQYIYHVMRHLISEPQENKMQLKFLPCLTEKYHSAHSPYALNELNLAITH